MRVSQINLNIERIRDLSLGVLTCLLIAGCGGANNESASSLPEQNSEPKSSQGVPSRGLSMAPIPYAGFMGEMPDREIIPDPCPFLSDEAVTAVSESVSDLKRSSISNNKCVWESKAAFFVTVVNDPIESARDFTDYAYNLDNPPVIEEQDGPGQNAVAMYDPTWDAAAPRIWAYGFEQAGRRVFLSTTGVRTSLESLRAAADEVSERMEDAPRVEEQYWDIEAGFDLCSVWKEADLLHQFDTAEKVSATSRPDECEWYVSLPNYKGVKLRLMIRDDLGDEFQKLSAIDRYDPGKVAGYDAVFTEEVETTWRIDDVSVFRDGRVIGLNAHGPGSDLSNEIKGLAENFVSRIESEQ